MYIMSMKIVLMCLSDACYYDKHLRYLLLDPPDSSNTKLKITKKYLRRQTIANEHAMF